jgi:hypothetical protein
MRRSASRRRRRSEPKTEQVTRSIGLAFRAVLPRQQETKCQLGCASVPLPCPHDRHRQWRHRDQGAADDRAIVSDHVGPTMSSTPTRTRAGGPGLYPPAAHRRVGAMGVRAEPGLGHALAPQETIAITGLPAEDEMTEILNGPARI